MNAHQRRVEKRRLLRHLVGESALSPRLRRFYAAFQRLWSSEALCLLHQTLQGEVFVGNVRVSMAPVAMKYMTPNYPGHARLRQVWVKAGPAVLRLQLHLPVRCCHFWGQIRAVCLSALTRAEHSYVMPVKLTGHKEMVEVRFDLYEEALLAGFLYDFQPAAPAFEDFRRFFTRRGVIRGLPERIEEQIVRFVLTDGPTEPCTNSNPREAPSCLTATTTPAPATSLPQAFSGASWPTFWTPPTYRPATRSRVPLGRPSFTFALASAALSPGDGSKPGETLEPSTPDPSAPTVLPSPDPTSSIS